MSLGILRTVRAPRTDTNRGRTRLEFERHGMVTRMTTTDRLFEAAYNDLCRIARGLPGVAGTSDPAALVNEAYLQFHERRFATCDERNFGVEEFVFVMALAMKTVARDRRRRESALKRGGGRTVVALDGIGPHEGRLTCVCSQSELHAFRELMRQLAADSPEWFAALVHYDLAGRTIRETAQRMGISEASARSYRRSALRWLRTALGSEGDDKG